MNVLVIGSGAREHAVTWKLSHSPRVNNIFVAPGNAGTGLIAENLPIGTNDIEDLMQAVTRKQIDFTVVGPEIPLARGIVDQFLAREMPIFGPVQAAAQIEASKAFSKDFMHKYHIPSAQSRTFSSHAEATNYINSKNFPVVIKADGLSQGKGVIIASNSNEATEALDRIMLGKAFGNAGNSVIVEEMLTGRELSVFSFSDSRYVSPIVTACDYKRIYDGNRGPNTGGMGSYSPADFYTPELGKLIHSTIMQPVIERLADEGRPYKGVLYGGIMLTDEGPEVLEFNARFGDPETQVILPLLKTDLVDIMSSIYNNHLGQMHIEWSNDFCVGVVMASGGYPGNYKTGCPISGLDDIDDDIMVFHAGTSLDNKGRTITSGGRVLTVVAKDNSMEDARRKVYDNIKRISFKDCYYRKDIALL